MSMQVLATIGRAQLRVIGLSPARISDESEARFPGAPTWNGMEYQETGLGERRIRIEAKTLPHVFGGLDALDWLRRHHEAREPVEYIRLGKNYAATRVGRFAIRGLYVDESRLHPLDGQGRKVDVELDLVLVGDR